jgi:succinoglycan biosynthesis protein ExoM
MISIIICTYKRPVLLKKCIESVINQITNYKYEIIVCDNDSNETARGITENYSQIQYYVQPLKGLSNARNMAVSKASGEFIIFIDDDEFADTNWISKMIECQKKYNADVIFGKVNYIVPEDYPNYIKNSIYFRRNDLITGQNASLNSGYSGNTLVRSSLFSIRNPPFLSKFNFIGGEDTDFFNFLFKNGSKMIFCNEAIIFEVQDLARKKVKWFYNRGYFGGFLFVKRMIEQNKFYKLVIIQSVIKDLLIILYLFFQSIFSPNKYFVMMIYKIGWLLGKFTYKLKDDVSNY